MRQRKIYFYFSLFTCEFILTSLHPKKVYFSFYVIWVFSFFEPHNLGKDILQQKQIILFNIKVSFLLRSFLLYPVFWLDLGTCLFCVTTSDWSLDSSIWSNPVTSSTLLRNRSASASSFLLVRDGIPFKIFFKFTAKIPQNYFRLNLQLLQNYFITWSW